jgi:hypothetical protein
MTTDTKAVGLKYLSIGHRPMGTSTIPIKPRSGRNKYIRDNDLHKIYRILPIGSVLISPATGLKGFISF